MTTLMYLPPSGPRRRSFLKTGLLGGLLLAIGGGGGLLLRRSRLVPLPKVPLQVLDEVEYAVMFAIAERLIPGKENFPSAEKVGVALKVDGVLARANPEAAAEVKQLLKLFENALTGALFGNSVTPFTKLSGDSQDAVLASWRDSRVTLRRTGYNALRTLAMATYYASKECWPAVGYPGPPEGFHQPIAPVWKGGDLSRP